MPTPTVSSGITRSPFSRVFTIENGAGPANKPAYQALARAAGVSQGFGDVTPVRIASNVAYDEYLNVDIIRGQKDLPGLDLEFRMQRDLSDIFRLVRKGCVVDVQLHFGDCGSPEDFNKGWNKILVLESGYPTNYSTDDLGAFDADQNASVMETVPFTGLDYYEIGQMNAAEQAKTQITDEVAAVVICDKKTCGACGIASDGCQVVFSVVKSSTGSPGLPTEIVFTQDGGATYSSTNITTMSISEIATDMACIGTNLVVISGGATDKLHYAPIANILAGNATWTAVTTGIVASGSPAAIFSASPSASWIVGDSGYVYKAENPEQGVTVQTDGSVTAQNLVAIHGLDSSNLVAVGASNAVIFTNNGGDTWVSVTGPDVGVALTCVWMRSKTEWFVGTAGGKLWYTRNKGTTWIEKTFPGSGSGVVRDLVFANNTVGFLSHDTALNVGRVLRTIDGGYDFYVLPEGAGTIPTARKFNSLAACRENPNVAFAGGLGNGATDGIVLKLS